MKTAILRITINDDSSWDCVLWNIMTLWIYKKHVKTKEEKEEMLGILNKFLTT